MTHGWNPEKRFFCQSYEDKDVLDSAVLIMPLVFFCSAVGHIFLGALSTITDGNVDRRKVLEYIEAYPEVT